MKNVIFVTLTLLTLSCRENLDLQENILADYLQLNANRELADLVACAGGKADGWLGLSSEPTDVLFYPIQGATDFRYFEAESIADSSNFSKYIAKDLNSEPVFNGYLWKFNNTAFSGERIGIVTYKTPGKIHVCSPIRLKTNVKPTEVNSDLVEIIENGTTPSFIWEDGLIPENIIYFQVISDAANNLISGTYTVEKAFTFYDLSNVVFNITDTTFTPTLAPNQNYKFTMMGVSDDNWVNLVIEQEFSTN